MKVLLLNPPRTQPLGSNVPSWVEFDTGAYPPLGVLYLAAVARQWADCDVSVIDAHTSRLTYPQLAERLRNEKPDVVGISALSFSFLDVIASARLVKQILPETHVCIGGPHAHLYPRDTLQVGVADTGVVGEGEYAFAELLKTLERTGQPAEIPGLAFLRDNQFVLTPPQTIEDLDALPFPDRSLLPVNDYHSALARSSPITTMMSSRGCPCKCIFCDRPAMGKRFRARSAVSVVQEMTRCVELGIREIFFYDDTFTINRSRVIEICELLRDAGLDVAWDIRARIDTVDRELLKRLRDAGCCRIHYGIEAGTERIQKLLRKNVDLDQARNVLRWTRDAGITSLAYFMIGNPTETRQEIETTLHFARKLKPDFIHLSVTTPFPGTELYFMAIQQGIVQGDPWQTFAENPTPDFLPPLWLEKLNRAELMDLLKRGYRGFYLRPAYIARSIFKIRTPSEFLRKARAGLGLLFSGKDR